MRSRRLDKLGELPALARARQRRAAVAAPPAAPPLPAVVVPGWPGSHAVATAPRSRHSRTPDSLTVGARFRALVDPTGGPFEVPYLRLSGRWLEEAGFTIGSSVAVHVEGGRLVLTCAATMQAEDGVQVAQFLRRRA